ncbi:SSS family transporter [Dyadobacter jejuensis]|uniref:SSS family transporter n=1 Tax=Dyadobacter jejuensis TaxID=1082580 RepID=A0A316ALM8_9BACT|nr:sodium/solute symporter [Dyadobacter jejuensis]PWJ58159.1 SSS family transporter [Dyadobacter jejuensis]
MFTVFLNNLLGQRLEVLDWAIIIFYALGMILIGWFYSRKIKTSEDYLLGGRKMNSTAIGISLFATLLSTLSYLSYPGEMIKHGPAVLLSVLAFPLIYFIAGYWLIPRIMALNVTSAYEILELRFGLSIRMFAIFMFLVLRFFWMATIIYVTVNIALRAIIPFEEAYVPLIGLLLMVITIIYTTMGGLKAVVVTDVIQTCVFLIGAIVSILVVVINLGSFAEIIPLEWPAHWDELQWELDTSKRSTLGNIFLATTVWYVCTTGSDQLAIQRYLSTENVATARKSFRISLYSNVLANILLAIVGLAMVAYFTKNQALMEAGQTIYGQADQLFPKFILIGLPTGMSGLVIAGLLSAAMSSMSSGLNSVSTVLSEDIFNRFRTRKLSASAALKEVKWISYGTGFVVILLSLFIANVSGNLYDVIMKVVNLLVAPLFVLFFMALFIPFATERATLLAGLASVAAAVAIAFYEIFGITVFWIMPGSLVVGIGTGVLLSWLDVTLSKHGNG